MCAHTVIPTTFCSRARLMGMFCTVAASALALAFHLLREKAASVSDHVPHDPKELDPGAATLLAHRDAKILKHFCELRVPPLTHFLAQ